MATVIIFKILTGLALCNFGFLLKSGNQRSTEHGRLFSVDDRAGDNSGVDDENDFIKLGQAGQLFFY